ncbi:unknown [[Mannheimia] succiniciproducens MBEL55E]|uniref:Uncharacterized protein n=1 Tax=Mannheimia succiniciproducens (strain KCTC 0769BP / MBEL55E) TaxID=221988 RepID=Q65VY3_MANSM|nr:unknown [[Mannheimia] succiniciproducens MBEL55E]
MLVRLGLYRIFQVYKIKKSATNRGFSVISELIFI